MFKIEKGKNKLLPKIANEFYSHLNPLRSKTSSLKKNSLKKRLEKKIRSERDSRKKYFYKLLAEHKFKLLQEIITGDSTRLNAILIKIDNLVRAKKIPNFFQTVGGVLTSTAFGTDVLKLFDYKSCRGSFKFSWLVEELDVVVCPYCNYNHTHKVKTINDDKILYEFDHFIPKVVAPYLSLSFFNLIPSCHVCNSNLKATTVFTFKDYANPYFDDLDSWFTFTTNNPVDINDKNSFDVEVKITTNKPNEIKKTDNNLKLFAIQPRYNHFKDDIIRLEKMKPKYSESKKQEMLNNGLFGEIFVNRADLNSHIALVLDIPLNRKHAARKEKGKFKLDIAKDFKILD